MVDDKKGGNAGDNKAKEDLKGFNSSMVQEKLAGKTAGFANRLNKEDNASSGNTNPRNTTAKPGGFADRYGKKN